jgi:hypothetical protein
LRTSLSMYLFCNSRIHVITLYSGHVCVYYVSMLRCWHLVWILVRTNHPCLEVGCHSWYQSAQWRIRGLGGDLGVRPMSSSRGLHILGLMRTLVSPSVSVLVSLPLYLFWNSRTSLSMYLFCNSRIHAITLYSDHVCVYYASMFRCCHLVWILIRTDHPCLGVGCHNIGCIS